MMNSTKTDQVERKMKARPFFILWLLCILGSWSVLPYIHYLGVVPPSISLGRVVLLLTLQSAFFFGLACWLSYLMLPKTDLAPFAHDRPIKTILTTGVVAGVLVGLTLYLFEQTLFASSALSGVRPPVWAGLLGALYGAINEEVLLRLFLFTAIYFGIGKLVKIQQRSRVWVLWITNVIVAIAFGLGHLPSALQLAPASSFEICRILFLNGIPGVVFGWLYWSRGLVAAMTAHFVTDVFIHVLLV